jgi:hypothetical protein
LRSAIGTDGGAEDLRAAAGQTGEAGVLHGQEHLALGGLLDPGQMGDLDRSERFDVHLGMALLEPADHVGVVAQPELGVQPADDVELPGGHPASLLRLVEHLLEGAGIGALFLRHAGERAERAGLPQHAQVRWIDVLIGGEEHPVAVGPAIREIRESPQSEKIGSRVERHPIDRREPLARRHLVGDGAELGVAQAGSIDDAGHAISLRLRR